MKNTLHMTGLALIFLLTACGEATPLNDQGTSQHIRTSDAAPQELNYQAPTYEQLTTGESFAETDQNLYPSSTAPQVVVNQAPLHSEPMIAKLSFKTPEN